GQIAQLQSLRWVKLLRPASLGALAAAGRASVKPFAPLLRPLAGGSDWLARRVAGGRLTARAPGAKPAAQAQDAPLRAEPLTPACLVEVTPAMHARARLRPLYDEAHVAWQFGEMARIVEQGEFTANLVVTPEGEPAGWYVYYLKPGGVSRVFALRSEEHTSELQSRENLVCRLLLE